jgi:hypothetical protein
MAVGVFLSHVQHGVPPRMKDPFPGLEGTCPSRQAPSTKSGTWRS